MERRKFLQVLSGLLASLALPFFMTKKNPLIFTGTVLRFDEVDKIGQLFPKGIKLNWGDKVPLVISNNRDKAFGTAELIKGEAGVDVRVELYKNGIIDPAAFKTGVCSVSGIIQKSTNHIKVEIVEDLKLTHISWPQRNTDPKILPVRDWKQG